ncbi:MAG: hypothetical protein HKN79_08450 [Flavobacteriales bacterium]|nr:hypothetical protein [Flavobacteriales bacterium]
MDIPLNTYHKRAITGGVISLVIILAGAFVTGELSGYEAKQLINASVAGLNTLCNTIVLASATILALLLTLVSVSNKADSKLDDHYYKHVLTLARVDTVVFISAMITFMFFNIPLTESDNVPSNWFSTIYYTSLVVSSVLSAALIVVVIMLFNTVSQIIRIVGLGEEESEFLKSEDDQEEEEDAEESQSS